ncbi:(deoxy)nucleoside triphosphate pyrophosphohydrolase [Methanosphaera sp. ISO3-F5]|uniref:(deoxy)nucleoside triphosphate pyrophosphohydrolase n=1 Tax=Methanosphaera sp. ISO3-F5 TaxID=1452353 RepID=UPI002B25F1E5|nr:(deoxy)nucleoside triphosphate pyrophosphohydrolase [Methanosphaera sp. ISO3-F5]WQH63644.1 (deoxy)nucleoside triphosphate pyrophosphohydrolase [Methanosphaera sp. ISO3-F5]
MKEVEVVAAIIQDGDKFLATKRGYGEFKGLWEFPGGKIEENETREEALIREIKEELTCDIKIKKFMLTVEYDYPTFHLIMHCYLCELLSEFTLLEHDDYEWLNRDNILDVEWLEADISVVNYLLTKI